MEDKRPDRLSWWVGLSREDFYRVLHAKEGERIRHEHDTAHMFNQGPRRDERGLTKET